MESDKVSKFSREVISKTGSMEESDLFANVHSIEVKTPNLDEIEERIRKLREKSLS